MLRECDYSQALLEQVNQAISDKTPLVIQGSNSKAFLVALSPGKRWMFVVIAALLITTRPSW